MRSMSIKHAVYCAVLITISFVSMPVNSASTSQSTNAFLAGGNECPGVNANYSTFNEYRHSSPQQNDTAGSGASVKILSLRRTAADMMLDLRFKILDLEQTIRIMDRKTPVYLIDQVSGYRYRVPVTTKLGPLRQTAKNVDLNKTYFIMFANPGRSIKKCDVVTVMIGDKSIDKIVVE